MSLESEHFLNKKFHVEASSLNAKFYYMYCKNSESNTNLGDTKAGQIDQPADHIDLRTVGFEVEFEAEVRVIIIKK